MYKKDHTYNMVYIDNNGEQQEAYFTPTKDTTIAGMINGFKDETNDFFKLVRIDESKGEKIMESVIMDKLSNLSKYTLATKILDAKDNSKLATYIGMFNLMGEREIYKDILSIFQNKELEFDNKVKQIHDTILSSMEVKIEESKESISTSRLNEILTNIIDYIQNHIAEDDIDLMLADLSITKEQYEGETEILDEDTENVVVKGLGWITEHCPTEDDEMKAFEELIGLSEDEMKYFGIELEEEIMEESYNGFDDEVHASYFVDDCRRIVSNLEIFFNEDEGEDLMSPEGEDLVKKLIDDVLTAQKLVKRKYNLEESKLVEDEEVTTLYDLIVKTGNGIDITDVDYDMEVNADFTEEDYGKDSFDTFMIDMCKQLHCTSFDDNSADVDLYKWVEKNFDMLMEIFDVSGSDKEECIEELVCTVMPGVISGYTTDRVYKELSSKMLKETVCEPLEQDEAENKEIKTETTKNQLRKMKDELFADTQNRNRAEWTDEEKTLYNKIRAIEMIHSILTYTSDSNWTVDYILDNKYMQIYIEDLGQEIIKELAAQEIEEYKSATINTDVYTDSEGVSYNSVIFKDEQ